ncbi:MAG: hypothetical protein ACE5QF_09150 [Thermoplasmata archaeon]
MAEETILEPFIKASSGVLRTEDMVIEAVRDLIKDEIKRYIRAKLEANPELKKEVKDAVSDYIEAKVKEGYALVKVAKCGAKLGLELVPEKLRGELAKELVAIFEKEIGAVIDRTA